MSQPALKIVKNSPVKTRKASTPRAKKSVTSLPRVISGALLGGFIPVAAHTLAHHSTMGWTLTGLIVAGCLLYSAPTVYQWAEKFGKLKAFGFVLCLEGVLVASPVAWLSWCALGLLAGVNACILATKVGKR